MNDEVNKFFSGYIEGYYGKILSWSDRFKIIKSLKKNNMNFYFYAPKEDQKHRFDWKQPYLKKWLRNFYTFSLRANSMGISIIAGIAPGLDFDFSFRENLSEFKVLKEKSKQLLNHGANYIALMFDDIPNNFDKIYDSKLIEGKIHAQLANRLADELNAKIFIVPRIYANELNVESPNYIFELGKFLYQELYVFHCGKKIVTREINNNTKNNLHKLVKNELVFWDNLYANDYCPRRLFISPWYNRTLKNIMINPTGMVNTDLLLLDIISNIKSRTDLHSNFLKTLKEHSIPEEFNNIFYYFQNPILNINNQTQKASFKQDIRIIDMFLWEWKSELALEWYPYLMGLKHDILIKNNKLNKDRIIKTQNKPLRDKFFGIH